VISAVKGIATKRKSPLHNEAGFWRLIIQLSSPNASSGSYLLKRKTFSPTGNIALPFRMCS